MNRTGEIVLTIIGALIYGFFGIVGSFAVWLLSNEEIINEAKEEISQQQSGITMSNLNEFLEAGVQGSGWLLIIVSVLALIVGIISVVFMKGDKKPKAAGIMLIVTAAISVVITLGAGIFSGLFYLIAGIMCLARKKPETITME
ncbi:hypothetical protein GCM10008983_04220 [Lentibacillus halophilus]|uniref:DUF4064 domain-containing protein n=1 Tax=Lentibacillus halophilus TaxID=295065 RepID=A0ABN0Z3K9_9BACI